MTQEFFTMMTRKMKLPQAVLDSWFNELKPVTDAAMDTERRSKTQDAIVRRASELASFHTEGVAKTEAVTWKGGRFLRFAI